MNATNLIIGLLMIGIGFLVKLFPNLIAGYNTMSQYAKKNVNSDGLSSYMRNGFYPSRNNGRKAALTYLALRIVLVFVIGSTAYGYMPSKINISENTIQFSGMYGFDLNVPNIENII
jgi:hypothetical protein